MEIIKIILMGNAFVNQDVDITHKENATQFVKSPKFGLLLDVSAEILMMSESTEEIAQLALLTLSPGQTELDASVLEVILMMPDTTNVTLTSNALQVLQSSLPPTATNVCAHKDSS